MWKAFASAALLTLASWSASAANFVAGVHYEIIADQPTATPEIREFFSFYCPHCYHFEPVLQKALVKVPSDTPMVKNHVDFMSFAPASTQTAMTRAYVAAAKLGKGHEAAAALFNAIHQERKRPANAEEVRAIVLTTGLDPKQFDTTLESADVNKTVDDMLFQQSFWSNKELKPSNPMLSMMMQQQPQERQPVLAGVPMLIVNGKYRINLAALDSSKIDQELPEIINFLLKNP
jgi:thiol:disulfide interchange protein DsbA